MNKLLSFSGGGWNSYSNLAGIVAGSLDKQESHLSDRDLDSLLADYNYVSGNSGGTWFLTNLAFSAPYRDSLLLRDQADEYNINPRLGFNAAVRAKFDNEVGYTSVNELNSLPLVGGLSALTGPAKVASKYNWSWSDLVEDTVYNVIDPSVVKKDFSSTSLNQWAKNKNLTYATGLTKGSLYPDSYIVDVTGPIITNTSVDGFTNAVSSGFRSGNANNSAIELTNFVPLSIVLSEDGSSHYQVEVGNESDFYLDYFIYKGIPGIFETIDDVGLSNYLLSEEFSKGFDPTIISGQSESKGLTNLTAVEPSYSSSAAMGSLPYTVTVTETLKELAPLATFNNNTISINDEPASIIDYDTVLDGMSNGGSNRTVDGGFLDNTSLTYNFATAARNGDLKNGFEATLFHNSSEPETAGGLLNQRLFPVDVLDLFDIVSPSTSNISDELRYNDATFGVQIKPSIFRSEDFFDPTSSRDIAPHWEWHQENGDIHLRYWELDVTTVENKSYGVPEGINGTLKLYLSQNPSSNALPYKSDIHNDYADNYSVWREALSSSTNNIGLFNTSLENANQQKSKLDLPTDGHYAGDNEYINNTFFHVLDQHGARTPASREELDANQETYFIIHDSGSGVGRNWLQGSNKKIAKNSKNWRISSSDLLEWQKFDPDQHALAYSVKKSIPDSNVVMVDWAKLDRESTDPLLNTSSAIGQYITDKDLDPKKITFIGHGVGAHIAGAASSDSSLPNKISRILALDPSADYLHLIDKLSTEYGYQFDNISADKRLDNADADDVFVIHTSSDVGYAGPLGSHDLYINSTIYPSGIYGLANYFYQPNKSSWISESDHSVVLKYASHMFAHDAINSNPSNSSYFDFLYDKNASLDFYGGALIDSIDSVLAVQKPSNISEPLSINTLFNKGYFDDSYFDWNFDASSPFSDSAGFWYDSNYLNRVNDGYQQDLDSVSLDESPDQGITFRSSEYGFDRFSIWSGPLKGGLIWFDRRTSKGFNFRPDPIEKATTIVNGQFELGIDFDQANKNRDKNNPYFVGFDQDLNEISVNIDGSNILDFRDGLVMVSGTSTNQPIDTLTGKSYGLPFIGIPGGNINIITTLKYASVIRWDDHDDLDNFGYRFTPEAINNSLPLLFRNNTAVLFDDYYNVYTELASSDPQGQLQAVETLTQQYALLALVQITGNLLNQLDIKQYLPDYLKPDSTPDEILNLNVITSALSTLYLDTAENKQIRKLVDPESSAFDLMSGDDYSDLLKTIFYSYFDSTELTPFQTEVVSRLGQIYSVIVNQMSHAIEASFDSAGVEMILPTIAGLKGELFNSDGLLSQALELAYSEPDNKVYSEAIRQKRLQIDSYMNYNSYNPSGFNQLVSLKIAKKSALKDFSIDQTESFPIKIGLNAKLNLPAPEYGLLVNYDLGGTAKYGKDYKIVDSDQSSFYISPYDKSMSFNVKLKPSFFDSPKTIQLSLTSSHSGFVINEAKRTLTLQSSQGKLMSSVDNAELSYSDGYDVEGANSNNIISIDKSSSKTASRMKGNDGADLFFIKDRSRIPSYIHDFDPYEGDRLVVLDNSPSSKSIVDQQSIEYISGKLLYNSGSSQSGDWSVLANFGDGINDSDQTVSWFQSKDPMSSIKEFVHYPSGGSAGDSRNNVLMLNNESQKIKGKSGSDLFVLDLVDIPSNSSQVDKIVDFAASEGDRLFIANFNKSLYDDVVIENVNDKTEMSEASKSGAPFIFNRKNDTLYFDSNKTSPGLGSGGAIVKVVQEYLDPSYILGVEF